LERALNFKQYNTGGTIEMKLPSAKANIEFAVWMKVKVRRTGRSLDREAEP
jgi:hypothetical protein